MSHLRSGNDMKIDGSHSNSVARSFGATSPVRAHDLSPGSATKSPDFPALKRSRSPPMPASSVSYLADPERELHAKSKRLARFGAELRPMVPDVHRSKSSELAKLRRYVENEHMEVDGSTEGAAMSQLRAMDHDKEDDASSATIVGLCQDMCPESERGERERKGDLDQYERLSGDRNQTHISLAVKKYNRTAERSALLIRPMPVLRKTMDYLMHLLDQPYDENFLGIYNFLWDRMRAVRMDLRMQHIFNQDAIAMLEQMIRLHIIAMHELCEYAKGEGFSEGFDAHLNIEQMNKASVELFQMYDDHRRKGLPVRTENEFRGYYALLKLDRHPGYRVEPAELSLDLAKMTPVLRGSPEILFARAVARACRTGNFISFFRLAKKATYLQACLMHAHFSKLRTNALASLHSSLQNNQGIPVAQVIQWLGMEGEDIEGFLKYHGFVIKSFEETYMVKDGPFLNVDGDYSIKMSELVHSKKSKILVHDVLANHVDLVPMVSHKRTDVTVVSSKRKPVHRITEASILSDVEQTSDQYHKLETPVSARKKFTFEGTKISPVTDQLAVSDVEMLDFQVLAPMGDGWKTELPITKSTPSTLHHNSEHTCENEHNDRVMSVSRIDSVIHHANFIDAQVTGSDIQQSTCEESLLKPEGILAKIDSRLPPNLEMQSPSNQKEIPVQRQVEKTLSSIAREKSEVAGPKLRSIIRTWKRWSSMKREIREQREKMASIALGSISLGPPIYWNETTGYLLSNGGEKVDLDVILKERNKKHKHSWSRLNVAGLVGSTLNERNHKASCLCWKLAVCLHQCDKVNLNSLVLPWLLSKLMGKRDSDDDDELVIVSSGISIWKSLVDGCDSFPRFCLSVVREVLLGDQSTQTLDDELIGTNAIIYVVSRIVPWEIQRVNIKNILTSLPSESRLPMLILYDGVFSENTQSIISRLELKGIGNTKVNGISVVSLAEQDHESHVGGFFSDGNLREGLKWLAEQTLPQPALHLVKTRELVFSHLNPLIGTLYNLEPSEVDPTRCITVFNEALDLSAKHIQDAADMNPNLWPCPESDLLDGINTVLPLIGWSSNANIKQIVDSIRSCKLPCFPYDVSFLSQGSYMGNSLPLLKMMLEDRLVSYLSDSIGLTGDLVKKEAHVLVQKGASIVLHGFHYYLIPRWVMIFQRIYNWRLMKLSTSEFASAYVLDMVVSNISALSSRNSSSSLVLNPQLAVLGSQFEDNRHLLEPPLDEMVEVACHIHHSEHEGTPQRVPDTRDNTSAEPVAFSDSGCAQDEEFRLCRPEAEVAVSSIRQNQVKEASTPVHSSAGFSKLRMLLEQCKILQDRMDQKLSLYF